MIGQDDVVIILGRRGTGKTTISTTLQDAFPRVVVIDRLKEYWNSQGKKKGVTHVSRTFQHFSRQILENQFKPNFKIVFQPERDDDVLQFNEALKLIYEMGDCLLVVEEAQFFCTVHTMPSMLKEILLCGRHRKIAFFATTQRPGELHKTMLSQASHVFAGPMHEPNDIKYLYGFMGHETEKLLHLKHLEKSCEFLYYRPGYPVSTIKIQFPV